MPSYSLFRYCTDMGTHMVRVHAHTLTHLFRQNIHSHEMKKKIFVLCVSVLYMFVLCVCLVPAEVKRGIRSPGIKHDFRSWRGGLAVGSTDWSSRGPWLDSQQPQGSSQPSVTPDPGDLLPPLASEGTRRASIHASKTSIHFNNFKHHVLRKQSQKITYVI